MPKCGYYHAWEGLKGEGKAGRKLLWKYSTADWETTDWNMHFNFTGQLLCISLTVSSQKLSGLNPSLQCSTMISMWRLQIVPVRGGLGLVCSGVEGESIFSFQLSNLSSVLTTEIYGMFGVQKLWNIQIFTYYLCISQLVPLKQRHHIRPAK